MMQTGMAGKNMLLRIEVTMEACADASMHKIPYTEVKRKFTC